MKTVFKTDWQHDYEIILRFEDGSFDWIDPIFQVYEDGENLVVEAMLYTYKYPLKDVDTYKIRVYSGENIYDVD